MSGNTLPTLDKATLHTRNFWLGSALALVSASAFALNLVFAGISYEYGANIHALNLARALLFLVALQAVIEWTRAPVRMPGRAMLSSALVGVLLCAEMYVLLGAIRTIPVALAVLVFYTYPMLIAVVRWISGGETFSWPALACMLAGFGGLVLVLITAPVRLETEGLVFSFIAALVMVAMLITSEKNLKIYDSQVALFHSLFVVCVIIVVLSLTVVDLELPSGAAGWLMFTGSTVFYVIATFTLFKAVSLIGPLHTAIIDTTAPVWAAFFGFMMLGQSLTWMQMLGIFVVVLSVILLQLASARR